MQYQYAGNPHLVYAVVRRRQCFEKLSALTLPQARAQAEIAQKRAAQPQGRGAGAGAAGGAAAAAAASNVDGHQVDSESANVPTSSTNLVGTTAQGEDGKRAPPNTGPAASSDDNSSTSEAATSRDASNASSETAVTADSGSAAAASNNNANSSGGFVPTAAWLASVRSELPLTTLQRLLQHLVPQVDELVRRSQVRLQKKSELQCLQRSLYDWACASVRMPRGCLGVSFLVP